MQQFVGETLNSVVLDSACTKTVCGEKWLKCYLDTLPLEESEKIIREDSDSRFQFGYGEPLESQGAVNIPAKIGSNDVFIKTDIVDTDLPLLLSKQSMKEAGTKLDFHSDTVNMFGEDIPLRFTSSGHYCIPISAKHEILNNKEKVFLTIKDLDSKTIEEKERIADKLHKQFGHPLDSYKLKKLVKEAKIYDKDLLKSIDKVTRKCDTCKRYGKKKPRPVVALSLAKDFNDYVTMDLKFIKGTIILHLIDVATCFSMAVVVTSRRKEAIVDKICLHWISIFGSPKKVMSDPGGEFHNDLLVEVGELLGVEVLQTAAESPWSNGICERHNAIIENMVEKVMCESKCSIDVALAWAVSAKNSLHNSYGYSPNQLVFGRNPNLPSVLTDDLPALEGVTSSELLAKHLNALHSARRAFIENESSEKLRRALRSKTRDITSRDFDIGDHVYYKRNGHNEWRGPGVIRAISGKTVLVQHGGFYNKVSPCALPLVNERDTYDRESYNDGLACGVDNVEPDNVEPYYGDEIEVDYNAIFDDQEFECDNGEQNVMEE